MIDRLNQSEVRFFFKMPMSPERDHHRGGRSLGRPLPPPRPAGYKVLCVSSLHSKASDDVIRDTLYREYKKYGDISVRVVQEPDERVAYVYFRNFEDARDAKHSKSRIILFDKAAIVEPVYESRPSESYSSRRRSITPPPPSYHHHGGHHPRYRSRSPIHHHHSSHHHPGPDRGGRYYDDHHSSSSSRGHHYRDEGYGGHHHRDHYGGGGRGGRGGYYGGGPPHKREHRGEHPNKKDKFPNYLNHIPPEDDPLATRTLFTGNLELNITDEEMRRIFGRYGKLVDIDIKRPPPGTGNAYAFIRYENLDMAARAKVELSGQVMPSYVRL